jgi:hypothetical protein
MSENVHGMLVYGIRIEKSDAEDKRNNKDPILSTINAGDHVNDKIFCSFLYILDIILTPPRYFSYNLS